MGLCYCLCETHVYLHFKCTKHRKQLHSTVAKFLIVEVCVIVLMWNSALWEEGKPVTSGILVDCNKQALFHATAWGLKLMGKERKLHDVAGEQGCSLNCGWQDIYNDNFGQWSPASLCTGLSGAPAAGQSRPYQALVVWFSGLCSMQIYSCDEFTATETNVANSWCSCILQRR